MPWRARRRAWWRETRLSARAQVVVGRSTNREQRPVDPDLALAAVRVRDAQDRRRCAHLRDREDHRPVAVGVGVERGIGRRRIGRDLDVAVAHGRDPRGARPAAEPARQVAPAAGEDERRVRQLSSDVLDGVAEGRPGRSDARWTENRSGTIARSPADCRSRSMARSIRRWIWIGWRRVPKRRAEGRSRRRSRKRSRPDRGRIVGRSLAGGRDRPPTCP